MGVMAQDVAEMRARRTWSAYLRRVPVGLLREGPLMLFGNSPMKPKGLLGMFAPGQSAIRCRRGLTCEASGHEYAPSAIPQARKPGFFAEGRIGRRSRVFLAMPCCSSRAVSRSTCPTLMQQRAFSSASR